MFKQKNRLKTTVSSRGRKPVAISWYMVEII